MDTATRLAQFVAAQEPVYDRVVRELSAGKKQTHWMWFVFPQLDGLGSSQMAKKFAICSLAEARDYMDHAVLGPRLKECTQLVLAVPYQEISVILGYPDDLKFHSCMTLFRIAVPAEPLFQAALQKFFGGEPDPRTIELLRQNDEGAIDESVAV